MEIGLRFGLAIASFIALFAIIGLVASKKLNIKYAGVWLLWALFMLFMAIFPETFYGFSDLLGIEMPVNAVFLIMIGLLYALTLYVYLMISKHNEEIIELTYQIAALEKELRDKDER